MSTATPGAAIERYKSVKDILSAPAFQERFKQVLGQRAAQFMSSVISASQQGSLAGCEPMTVVSAALTAAALDLPIEKQLGFAHLVPYEMKSGRKICTFQIGYKGLIQLAQRSRQYQRMNDAPINAEAFSGYDEVGEPVIDWEKWDPSKPPVGYFFGWTTTGGFTKKMYWPRTKVQEHAARYSQAYRAKGETPWSNNFDAMALKTVIKAGLGRYGILSIEMAKALEKDETAETGSEVIDISAEASEPPPPKRIAKPPTPTPIAAPTQDPTAPAGGPPDGPDDQLPFDPPSDHPKPTPAMVPVPTPAPVPVPPQYHQPPTTTPPPQAPPAAKPQGQNMPAGLSPQEQLQWLLNNEGIGFDEFRTYVLNRDPSDKRMEDADSYETMVISLTKRLLKEVPAIVAGIKAARVTQ